LTVKFSTGATPPRMHLLARQPGDRTLRLRPS
jgi:hypothetical protein